MKHLLILLMSMANTVAFAQQIVTLFDGPIPGSKPLTDRELNTPTADGSPRISRVSQPTLTVYMPPKDKANGSAVIICPGGGYARLAIQHEGYDVAKLMSEWGVTAFVLKYRLPDDSIMHHKEIGPLQDAQRAIQWVRMHAKDYNIAKNKVGIMGFSAGGHLAASLGTQYKNAVIPEVRKINLRPDFMVLIYPVISLTDSLAHKGSQTNLLGKNPSGEMIKKFSNELHVNKKTPPAFLVHAKDDKTVKVENSMYFYDALQQKKVRSEIHLYEKGGHGFGLKNSTSPDKWSDWLKVWMQPWL